MWQGQEIGLNKKKKKFGDYLKINILLDNWVAFENKKTIAWVHKFSYKDSLYPWFGVT